MAKPAIGATILYCGHEATFLADIWEINGVNVVRASSSPINLSRPATKATHQIRDFPVAGFWRPDLGIFVVPEKQVISLADEAT